MSLVESCPSTRDAVERALHAHAEQQVGGLGRRARRRSARSTASSRSPARSSRRPWPGRTAARCPTAARRRATRASRTRRWCGSPRRSRRRRSRRARSRAASDAGDRSRPIVSGTPITPVEATATWSSGTPAAIAAAPCMRAASSSPRRPGRRVRVAGVGDDGAQRVQPAALLREQDGRGEHAGAGEARRADGRPARRRRAARGRARRDGLRPAGHAGRAEAGRGAAARSVTWPAARPSASEQGHRQALALVEPEHQVEVLDRLRRGALPQVVDRREHDAPAGARVAVHGDPAEVRVAHVEHAGRPEPQLDPRLARVGVVEEVGQLAARRRRARASRSRTRARPGRAGRGAA